MPAGQVTNNMVLKITADPKGGKVIYDSLGRVAVKLKTVGKTTKSQSELMKLALNRVNNTLKLQTKILERLIQTQQRQVTVTKRVATATKDVTKKTEGFGRASKTLRITTTGVRESLGRLRNQILVVVFAYSLFTRVIKPMIAAATKQEFAERKLEAALKGSGLATKAQVQELKALAAAYQQTTMFGDEQIINAQAMLATFKLNSDQIAQITPRMLDMATSVTTLTGKQIDLQTIAIALGKGFTGQTGILARYGVVLSQTAKKSGDFNLILAEIDKNYKGIAEGMRTTYIGQTAMYGNAMGDLKEQLGFVITKSYVFLALLEAQRNAMVKATEKMKENRKAADNFSRGWMRIVIFVIAAKTQIKLFWRGFVNGMRVVTVGLFKLYEIFFRGFEKMHGLLAKIPGRFGKWAKEIEKSSASMAEQFRMSRENVLKDMEEYGEAIRDTVGVYLDEIENINQLTKELEAIYGEVFDGIADRLKNVGDQTQETWDKVYELTVAVAKNMESAFSNLFFDVVTRKFKDLRDYIDSFTTDVVRSLSKVMASLVVRGIMPGAFKEAAPWDLFGFLGGLFGGGKKKGSTPGKTMTLHGGGIARFQKGGVVPALLESGEGVVSRRGMSMLGREGLAMINRGAPGAGRQVTNIYNINAIDVLTFRQYLAQNEDLFVSSVYGDIEGNYALRKLFRSGV